MGNKILTNASDTIFQLHQNLIPKFKMLNNWFYTWINWLANLNTAMLF